MISGAQNVVPGAQSTVPTAWCLVPGARSHAVLHGRAGWGALGVAAQEAFPSPTLAGGQGSQMSLLAPHRALGAPTHTSPV